MLDLYECPPGVCDDIGLCYRFLEEIVEVLGMTKQSPPYIFKSDGRMYPDKTGLSGWVPLIESGIQIHTLAPKNFISIDVYSCGKFSADNIKDFVCGFFHPKEVEINLVARGINYHQRQAKSLSARA